MSASLAKKGKGIVSSESRDGNGIKEEVAADELLGEVRPGDLIWVKVSRKAWWPAQVNDENTVSESNKPCNRSVGEILVRLYGSYDYLYVDPVKCHSEFEIILRQNNGSYREILNNALARDLNSSKSGRSKTQGSRSAGNARSDASKKKLKVEQNHEVEAKDFAKSGCRKTKASKASKDGKGTPQAKKSDMVQVSPRTSNTRRSGTKGKNADVAAAKIEEGNNRVSKKNGVKRKYASTNSTTKEKNDGKTSNEAGVQKKLRLNDSGNGDKAKRKSGPLEEAKGKTSRQSSIPRKLGSNRANTKKEAKSKTCKQDEVQRVKQNNTGRGSKISKEVEVLGNAKNKVSEQDEAHKNVQSNSSNANGSKFGTPKQDKMLNNDNPGSEARSMRVMQNLGLIAPSGSPFKKNANICLSL